MTVTPFIAPSDASMPEAQVITPPGVVGSVAPMITDAVGYLILRVALDVC